MLLTRPFRGIAVAALTGIGATVVLAGPLAVTALAQRPAASAAPAMTATPPPQSSSTAATFAWTASATETFSCFLDGARSNCGSDVSGSKSYTNLAEGTHSFFVKGKQAGHFRAATSPITTWRVDLTAPAAPTVNAVTPNPTRNTSADITFSKADADTASFVCALDDADPTHATACNADQPPSLSFHASGLSQGSHTLYVYALDAASPTPNRSVAGTTTWVVDLTAPGSPVFTAQPAASTSATTASFAWTDDPTATGSTCSLDDVAFSACSQSDALPRSATLSNLSAGPHTFVVKDSDSAGNTSTALATWDVDLTAPPAPQVVSGPAATTDQSSASFVFSDADTTATFLCHVTSGGTEVVSSTACSSPFSLPSLADGTYTFSVQAKDPAGNTGPATPYTWTVDTTDNGPIQLSPVAFLTGPAAFSNAAHPTFTWVGLDDLTTGFVCAVDSNVFADCGAPDANGDGSFTLPAGVTLSEATHVLAVKAGDGSGNFSPPATYSWTFDKTPPPAPMFSTTPPQPSNSTSAVFSFASEPDASFTCGLSGPTVVATSLCASPVSFSSLQAGDYTFVVHAMDAAGNVSETSYPWTIDPSVPSAPMLTGPTGFLSSPDAHFSWTDADGAAITGYTCSLDGATATSCVSPHDLTGLADGPHSFAVSASNGTKTSTSTNTWTIDTAKPVLTVAGLPANGAVTNISSFAPAVGQTDANPGALSCVLSGPAGAATCGPYLGLPDGVYTLTVTTIDAAGNAADAVTTGWTVDTTPPPAPVVSGPADTTSTRPTLTFTDAESSASLACSLDGGAFAACSSPFSPASPLAVGTHTFVVRASDSVGNAADSAPFTLHVSATAAVGGPIDAAPTATIATPTTLTGSATATFSETVHALTAGAASFVVAGTSTVVPTNATCLSGASVVACGGAFTSVRLSPRAALTPGQHYAVQLATGAVQDSAGNPSVAGSKTFRASLAEQENSVAAQARWVTVRDRRAYGKRIVRESVTGATASYTFTGRNVTWWTMTGRDQGKATVFVDGVRKAVVDNYAATTHVKVARRFARLGNKTHTLRIVVRGRKGARAGTGTFVAIDAFSVGKSRVDNPAVGTTWRSAAGRHYSAGHAATARLKNETMSFAFRGTAISWFTQRGVNQGKVAVYVDGVRKAIVDDYAAKTTFGVKRSVTRLADTVHTLKLVVLGTHHRGATGTWVTVDRFQVG